MSNIHKRKAKKEHFRLFGFTSTINICRFVLILAIKFNEGTCNDFDVLHPPFNNLSRGLKSKKKPTQNERERMNEVRKEFLLFLVILCVLKEMFT